MKTFRQLTESSEPKLTPEELKALEKALEDAIWYESEQDNKDRNHLRLITAIQRKFGFKEGHR